MQGIVVRIVQDTKQRKSHVSPLGSLYVSTSKVSIKYNPRLHF
jgi:hypothetical protein